MRFNNYNVDIDDALINAFRSGEVVIFVGAGVSDKFYPRQPHGRKGDGSVYFGLF